MARIHTTEAQGDMNSDFLTTRPYPVSVASVTELDASVDDSASDSLRSLRVLDESLSATASAWSLSRTRRAMDFLAAAIALGISLPLMAVVAIAVRLSSPGPAIFRQERMGRNGHIFTLYKFRSMRTNTTHSSPITVAGDNRITNLGRFLRKYKLDELPQFWNVLCGDMSLVGPRPKLQHHEALHMPFRPGITGAATLAFRFEEEMLKRVPREHLDNYYDRYVKPCKARIDSRYMENATPLADLRILWQTMKLCYSSAETSYHIELPNLIETSDELSGLVLNTF